ncbi:MAG: peptide chain release factor N(5)-glutamine methyltransferase [Clostridia bacterium]|nr:peptide chain release factor N(5)-glutamine methyltransferase [Clostridia bacterium]
MTIKELLTAAINMLKKANIEAPAFEAGVILCNALECDRTHLYTHGEAIVADNQVERVFTAVKLRAERNPLQYITGHQEFMSLDFIVNPNVLIPRQDTEILVEAVLKNIAALESKTSYVNVLDIGTGSGCIAVSIAYYRENCRVTAVDISEKALETAKVNAANLCTEEKVIFIKSDLFDALGKEHYGRYNVIVSNPPYIPSGDIGSLQEEVKQHEPHGALDGGDDGLDFYREIIDKSRLFLTQGGTLAFETGYDQARAVAELMKNYYENIEIIKDLSGTERVVLGRLA